MRVESIETDDNPLRLALDRCQSPLDRCHLAGLTWHCSPKLEAMRREGYIAFAHLENVLVAHFETRPLSCVSWNEVKRWAVVDVLLIPWP